MSKRNSRTNKEVPRSLVYLTVNEITVGYKLAVSTRFAFIW